MYHDVTSGRPASAGGGPARFNVSIEDFELMLDSVRQAGSQGSSVADVLAAPAERRVGITFDDGTSGQFEFAAPALRSRGMTATFFVTTDWVGTSGFMNWDQLRLLREWGMSVQSHTRSHPHLSELDDEALIRELTESKAMLDQELDQETRQIALPGGNAPRPGLRHRLGECGYDVVATSRWGTNASSARGGEAWIRRCTAPRELTPELAARIVRGDPTLTAMKWSREAALNGIRAIMGADRYARWRRRVLDAVSRQAS